MRPGSTIGGTPPEADAATRPQKRAGGGVVASWIRFGLATVIGIAQAPILFSYVPPAELGIWYLFFTVATFISLSDLGLPSTFGRAVSFRWGRELSGERSRSDHIPSTYVASSLHELYGSALAATALLSIAFAVIAAPAALLYFSRALPSGPLQRSLAGPLMLFLVGVVLNLLAAIPGACLSGTGDVTWDSATRAVASVIGFTLVCILVPTHRSLGVLCAIYAVQGVIGLASSHWVLVRRHRLGSLRDFRPRAALIRGMFRESTPLFVSRMGMWLTAESTLLIGGYFLGSERIADFGILKQLVSIGASVTTAIPNAVSPHTSAAFAAGDHEKVRSMFLATLRYGAIVSVLWTVGLLIWTPSVLGFLVGDKHFLGYGVLVPVAVGSFLELFASIHGSYAWNIGRWPFTPYIAAGGLLNVVLASTGCALFGFEGLAWGPLAAQLVTVQWFQVVYALRESAIGIARYTREMLRPVATYAAMTGAVAMGVRVLMESLRPPAVALAAAGRVSTALWALVGIVATTALAGIVAWSLALTGDDRRYFAAAARLRR